MQKKLITIKPGQYEIIGRNQPNVMLHAIGLNRDIAFKFMAQGEQTIVGGVARAPSFQQLKEIFNLPKLGQPKKIVVDIVGGDGSPESYNYFNMLMETLESIDSRSGVFDITWRVNRDIHPDFCLLAGEEVNSGSMSYY